MALVPFLKGDAWRSMETLRDEINRLFDTSFRGFPTSGERMYEPSVDMWEDENNLYVESDIPGMEKKDIKVNVSDDSLVISAKKEEKKEENTAGKAGKKDYHRSERYQGSFYRAVELPAFVDASKAKANYKKGVLTVELPKREEHKRKELKIDVE